MSLSQTTPLRGASFRPDHAKQLVLALSMGDKLELERDPDNQYDQYAIKIMTQDEHIGFVAKEIAVALAPEMDAEGATWEAEVVGFNNPLTPVVYIQVTNSFGEPPEPESLDDEIDDEIPF